MTVARKTKTVVYNKVTRGREGDLMMQNATKLRFEERRFERSDYSSNNFLVFAKIFQFLDRFERNIRGIVGGFEATFDRRAIGGERRKRRGNDAIKEGENRGKKISPCQKASSFYKSRVSLRKIKISRAIQRQASGPCIKGVLTGVSCGVSGGGKGRDRERAAATRNQSGRTQKRGEKSLPRGKLFVDAFPSSRLPVEPR